MDTAYYSRPIQQKLDKAPRRDPPSPRKEQAHPELRHPTTKQVENYKKEGVLDEAAPSLSPRDNSEPPLQRTEEGKPVDVTAEVSDDDPAAKFMKSFSILSAKTLGHLDQLEAALHDVEMEVSETEQDLISGEMSIGKAKDDLAQIEARLDKLQFNGIDSVQTVDLHSGKEPAKAARKELVRQAENLSARIDKIFKQIKEAEKTGHD
ncbi:hypothetical protein FOZ61_002240 [Perkinsus olseni]|uniref:Uncharacterized protein n=1 Tax=Perkinsus olseni TaxID=32597 RepID=A0A7J6LU22_PEROL|nr:hypothetical protein FOZ61_002240 [Perkinsus olseni]KAF4668588.1 hypothetical protein FOL46_001910 [Perkinsus olseni]